MAELTPQKKALIENINRQKNKMLLDFGNYIFSRQREEDLSHIIYPNETERIKRFRTITSFDISNWEMRKQRMDDEKNAASEMITVRNLYKK